LENKNRNSRWITQSEYSNNISSPKIKIKNLEISINTIHIFNYALGFTKFQLSEADAKNGRSSIGSGKYKRYKSVSSGNLYYEIRINNWKEFSYGDWRIKYYKLATENKISILGEKKGNEIIPKKDLKGYENNEVFKSIGDDYRLNDFIQILKDHVDSSFVVFLVISIIIIIIGIFFLVLGFMNIK